MGSALPLPWPSITDNKPGSFANQVQENFDALAIAAGSQAAYLPWVVVGNVGAPTFQNSWVIYDGLRPLRFYKDPNSVVRLSGAVKSGTNASTVFTLPAGYRPGSPSYYSVYAELPAAGTARVSIDTTGTVLLAGVSGTTMSFIDLSVISFRAEQ